MLLSLWRRFRSVFATSVAFPRCFATVLDAAAEDSPRKMEDPKVQGIPILRRPRRVTAGWEPAVALLADVFANSGADLGRFPHFGALFALFLCTISILARFGPIFSMDVPGAPQPARFVCQNSKTAL